MDFPNQACKHTNRCNRCRSLHSALCQAAVSWKNIFLLAQLLYSFSSLILLSCITLRLLALQNKSGHQVLLFFLIDCTSKVKLSCSSVMSHGCSSLFSANQSCIWMLVSSTLDLVVFRTLGPGWIEFHPGNNEVITRLKEIMKVLHYNFKMVVCILRNQPQTADLELPELPNDQRNRSGFSAFGKTRDHGWGKVAAKSSVNSSYPWH